MKLALLLLHNNPVFILWILVKVNGFTNVTPNLTFEE